jgi:sugar lactone lactonase YvrE
MQGNMCTAGLRQAAVRIQALLFVVGMAATAPAEELFVANHDDRILRFDSSGAAEFFADSGNGKHSGQGDPFGLAFDKAGNLYVSNRDLYQGYNIKKFDASGGMTIFAGPGPSLDKPAGLAFDSAGNLYVANQGNNTIEKFDPWGVGTVFANTLLNSPTALAFSDSGDLYVANGNAQNIVKFDTAGHGSIFAPFGLSSPTGVAFDGAGHLFATSQNGTIVEFDSAGSPSVFARVEYDTPMSLAFNASGDLFVTTVADRIEVFDPSGARRVFADRTSGLFVPTGLAFRPEAVPDSGSLMALLGASIPVLLAIRFGRKHRLRAHLE